MRVVYGRSTLGDLSARGCQSLSVPFPTFRGFESTLTHKGLETEWRSLIRVRNNAARKGTWGMLIFQRPHYYRSARRSSSCTIYKDTLLRGTIFAPFIYTGGEMAKKSGASTLLYGKNAEFLPASPTRGREPQKNFPSLIRVTTPRKAAPPSYYCMELGEKRTFRPEKVALQISPRNDVLPICNDWSLR